MKVIERVHETTSLSQTIVHLRGNENITAFLCNAPQQLNQEDSGHPLKLTE